MKITLFTLDAKFSDDTPNKSLHAPLHQLCVRSWGKLLDLLKRKGYEAELKIYTCDSPEWQFIEREVLIPKQYSSKRRARMVDVFRMYILSQHPRHIWLDWDVFIRDNFDIDFEKSYLMEWWYFIYNADNTEMFKQIFNCFCDYDLTPYGDSYISAWMKQNNLLNYDYDKSLFKMLVHCPFIDDKPVSMLYFINDDDEQTDFVQYNKQFKKQYIFINPKRSKHHGIMGLYNEKELIDCVKEIYPLTEEQIRKLEE